MMRHQQNYADFYYGTRSSYSETGLVRIIYVSKTNHEIDIYCDQIAIATNVLSGHIIDYLEFYGGIHELKVFNSTVNREQIIISQLFEVVPNKQITLILLDHVQEFKVFSIMDEVYPNHDNIIQLRYINLRDTIETIKSVTENGSTIYQIGFLQMTPYLDLKNIDDDTSLIHYQLIRSKGEAYSLYLIPVDFSRFENRLVIKDKKG